MDQCLLCKRRSCNPSKVRSYLFYVCLGCNSRHDLESTKDHHTKHMTPKAVKIMVCLLRTEGTFSEQIEERKEKRNPSPLIKHEMTPLAQRPCFLLATPGSKVSSREGRHLIFPLTSSSFLLPAKMESLMALPSPLFKHLRVLQDIKQKSPFE